MSEDVFANYPVAARMPDEELASKLAEIEVLAPSAGGPRKSRGSRLAGILKYLRRETPLWKSNSHAFGYIADPENGATLLEIVDVGAAPPDKTLQQGRIDITLNYLRVADYPGAGTHRILFDFYAQNQLPNGSEEVHFNATYRILDHQRAGIRGYPVFIGLTIGSTGLALRCYTVNVKNDDDERLLAMLDSDALKNGLRLATTVQPAIAPLTSMAVALTKSIAGRNRNIPVQDIFLGLDFSRTPGGGRLAKGAYVMVQIPEENRLMWDWKNWVFDLDSGQVVKRSTPKDLIPFNYLVIGIRKHEET